MNEKVLIIDDDEKLVELLRGYLEDFGYRVDHHGEGTGVIEALERSMPDIVFLDIMLPGKDGVEVLRELRAHSHLPVIMLTARGDEADRIVGLELGADDYLPKPFNPRELLARMKAVLRRSSMSDGTIQPAREKCVSGGISLNSATMRMECGDRSVELSRTEYRIMEALMTHANMVLSRDSIMNIARGRDFLAFERSIDMHISRLRAKVEDVSGGKGRIKTVWGTGYMFVS
jgi:two-component system phosphate regulon response regulator OmpR